MAAFIIEGGHPLSGTIQPQGAKNEALQVICASLLTSEEVIIRKPTSTYPIFAQQCDYIDEQGQPQMFYKVKAP